MSDNPQHNRHIIELADTMEGALAENNQWIIDQFKEILTRLDKIEADIAELKQKQENIVKNNPPAPVMADLYITSQSAKKLQKQIGRYLN